MWSEPILHVDMDAFFVEVERRDDPSLIGRPVAVGGTGNRGVIASASYEARAHGVRSAQPTAIALRMCPGLRVIPSRHDRYSEASEGVFAVFRRFTPRVEGLSLDEAFLDVAGLTRHFESPVDVADAIRELIRAQLSLPASVGIASTKFMAKLASEAAKPDGVLHVPVETQLEFLHALPVSALWGVGPATLAGLERLGVETIGDLAELPEPAVVAAMGEANGRHLVELSRGIDRRQVEPDSEAKSISVEETYEHDLVGRPLLETALLAHSQRLSGRLRRAGVAARTVVLKVRYGGFDTVTRSRTGASGVDSPRDIYMSALDLLADIDDGKPVRLLGLGGANLESGSGPRQLSIDSGEQWDRVADAVSSVRERFGEHAVEPARLITAGPEKPVVDR